MSCSDDLALMFVLKPKDIFKVIISGNVYTI